MSWSISQPATTLKRGLAARHVTICLPHQPEATVIRDLRIVHAVLFVFMAPTMQGRRGLPNGVGPTLDARRAVPIIPFDKKHQGTLMPSRKILAAVSTVAPASGLKPSWQRYSPRVRSCLVVPLGASGAMDVIIRTMGSKLTEQLG